MDTSSVSAQVNPAGLIRIKRFANGRYALSAADPEQGRYTLVEGSAKHARVVHVDRAQWTEAVAGPATVRSGTAVVAYALFGDDGRFGGHSQAGYPSGLVRLDDVTDGVRRTQWQLADGGTIEASGDRTGRELVRLDANGTEIRRLRTQRDDRRSQTEIFDGAGERLGVVTMTAMPGGMVMSTRSDEQGGTISSTSQRYTGPDGSTATVTTTGQADGTVKQTYVFAGKDGVGVQHIEVRPDGSGKGDSVVTVPTGDGGSVTVTQNVSTGPNGTNATGGIDITDNTTGERQGYQEGVNDSGESYRTGYSSDGKGNSSQTTVTYHEGGGFTITTITQGNGQGSVNSQDFDKDGNPITPGGNPDGGGGNPEPGDGDGGGNPEPGDGDGGGDPEPDDGGGDDGMPNDDGSDEGPPKLGFGQAGSFLGDPFETPFGGLPFGAGSVPGHSGGSGEPDDGRDPRMAGLRAGLIADVVRGGGVSEGDPENAPSPQSGGGSSTVYDSTVPGHGIVPTEDWGDSTDPRVLVAAVANVAGARAGALAELAFRQTAGR